MKFFADNSDYKSAIRRIVMPTTEAKPLLEDYWRCFHCDFATRDAAEAEAHFGERDDAEEFKPICKWWASLDAGEKIETLQTCLQDLNYERMENYKADQQLRAMDLVFIGTLRRDLFMNYDCKWNGYVRDITAELEQDEQVSRRAVNERIYKDSAQLMTALELAKGSPSEGTGWISAQQKMPAIGRTVIVQGGIAFRSEDEWISQTGAASGRPIMWPVTHWMPIPPLPAPPVAPPEKEVK